jgi:hypothetical protein
MPVGGATHGAAARNTNGAPRREVQHDLYVVFVHKLLHLLGEGPDVLDKGGVEALDVLE